MPAGQGDEQNGWRARYSVLVSAPREVVIDTFHRAAHCCRHAPLSRRFARGGVLHASRANVGRISRHRQALRGRLIASAEEVPAAKYGYKPTAKQMTIGEIVVHLAEDNDRDCARIGGTTAPARSPISATDSKDRLVARLKETFAYCDRVLASLDDTKITDQVSADGEMETRIQAMMDDCGHWADHYSQFAIYLRLNGLLPPTATDPTM